MREIVQFTLFASMAILVGCSNGSGLSSTQIREATGVASPSDANGATSESLNSGSKTSVSLSTSDQQVDVGQSVNLNWSSSNASGCEASGAWSGTKSTSGSETVGPLDESQTYTLTCQGASGSAVTMLSVDALGILELGWQAPVENVDGTPVKPLSAYRIHYGTTSGGYDESVEVSGTETNHTMKLPVGGYYIAMTAIDVDNQESALSNEITRYSN